MDTAGSREYEEDTTGLAHAADADKQRRRWLSCGRRWPFCAGIACLEPAQENRASPAPHWATPRQQAGGPSNRVHPHVALCCFWSSCTLPGWPMDRGEGGGARWCARCRSRGDEGRNELATSRPPAIGPWRPQRLLFLDAAPTALGRLWAIRSRPRARHLCSERCGQAWPALSRGQPSTAAAGRWQATRRHAASLDDIEAPSRFHRGDIGKPPPSRANRARRPLGAVGAGYRNRFSLFPRRPWSYPGMGGGFGETGSS